MNYFQQQREKQKDIVNVFIPQHEAKKQLIEVKRGTWVEFPRDLSDEVLQSKIKAKLIELGV